jgi:hypothetical protein
MDEVALIRDTTSHYAPVLIAPLSIRIRRAGVQKSLMSRASGKLRSWRVSIIRKRGQYLGTVEAPNEKAAEAAAVAEFDLRDEQRRRFVLSEQN